VASVTGSGTSCPSSVSIKSVGSGTYRSSGALLEVIAVSVRSVDVDSGCSFFLFPASSVRIVGRFFGAVVSSSAGAGR